MERQLMILEVSQKQAYIFAPRALKDNRRRSEEIAYVTSSTFFQTVCPAEYTDENMVYSGGGHTVLQFTSKQLATDFAKKISLCVMEQFPEMELFIKQRPYDNTKTPGENLLELSRDLETKKAHRKASFRTYRIGVESEEIAETNYLPSLSAPPPQGWTLSNDADDIAAGENFLAVVHLDGNSMGVRVQQIYQECGSDWERCRTLLQLFSSEIDRHFSEAFQEMSQDLAQALEEMEDPRWDARILPLRKIIGAGDDVCFITAGDLGLECAASFIQHLNGKINQADKRAYSACAGIVLIHKKFPFRRAYDMTEQLCSNAKSFGVACGENISAIDYHIEFGQMKETLTDLRADYIAEDGSHMELRPAAITGNVIAQRRYSYLTQILKELKKNEQIARSKLKQLRTALSQGEIETMYSLRATNTEQEFTSICANALPDSKAEVYFDDFTEPDKPVRRSLIFDAIELMDHITLWRKE